LFRSYIDKELKKNSYIDENDENEYSVYKICKQIDLNTNDKWIKEKTKDRGKNEHVMISYHTASRSLCLQVKADLETNGYKVWMDVVDIHGGSLNSMAKAVEGAAVVLMCVTEKYRASVNCQGEAQYSMRCNKPIIPCIMQAGVESVGGWLGLIMGDKITVHFMKNEFGECMQKLKSEIEVYCKAYKTQKRTPHPAPAIFPSTDYVQTPASASKRISDVAKWNADQVEDWFKKNDVNPAIIRQLKPCDGALLNQM
jgi:hypothetical protein